jgi:flagellar basal-body rod protein FlgB
MVAQASACGSLFPQRLGAGIWIAFPSIVMLEGLGSNLEHYMNLLSARQKLVASNLANADTPGYKTQDIDFQREFESQIGSQPTTIPVPGLGSKNDGNNVNVDREARLLSENALRFNVASTLVRGQITQIREAIQDGKSS